MRYRTMRSRVAASSITSPRAARRRLLLGFLMTPRKRVTDPKDDVRLQDTVRLSAAGAGMLLGDLEHRVLQAA